MVHPGISQESPGYLVFWDLHVGTPMAWYILGYSRNPRSFNMAYAVIETMYPRNPGILSILESTPMAWDILGYPGILSILGLACRYMYSPMAWDILGYPRNPGILGILGSTCSYRYGIWDILGYSRNPRSFYMAYAVP